MEELLPITQLLQQSLPCFRVLGLLFNILNELQDGDDYEEELLPILLLFEPWNVVVKVLLSVYKDWLFMNRKNNQ